MIFISCEQDESLVDPVQEEVAPDYEAISSARDWFFTQTGGDVLLEVQSQTKSTGNSSTQHPLLGDWENGLTKRIDNIKNVEVPVYSVDSEEAYSEALNGIGSLKSSKTDTNDENLPSRTRFVVQTDEKTGETRGFLMTVIPDEEYLTSGGSIDSMDYYNRGNDFSGLIVFNHLDGSFANAWEYEEGEVIKGFLPFEKKETQLKVIRNYTIVTTYCNEVYSYAGDYSFYKGRHCWKDVETVLVFTATFDSGGGGSPLFDRPSSEFGTIGGGSYFPSGSLEPLTNKIALNNKLLPSQTLLLEDALEELIGVCSDGYIYDELVAKGKKFNFAMDSSLGGLAGYDPASKTFSFRNNDAISSGKLKEEFFHAFQDAYYTGGISQYYKSAGSVNIEFEAKLYRDITAPGCCMAFYESRAPQNIKDDYEEWIRILRTSQNFVISPTNYQKWLKLFNQYTTSYSSPTSSSLNYPHALDHILNMSNCF